MTGPRSKAEGIGRKRAVKTAFVLLGASVSIGGAHVYAVMQQDDLDQALIVAVEHNNANTVTSLLNKGANANAIDTNPAGLSRLNRILMAIYTRVGINSGPKAEKPPTALLIAEEPALMGVAPTFEHTLIVKTLLDRKARVNERDIVGRSPLIMAAVGGYTEDVQLLLSRGADVNIRDNQGNTALLMATGRDHAAIVKALIAKGADVNVRNRWGHSALWNATSNRDRIIVDMLRRAGARIKP